MTATGFLVGILASVGLIALATIGFFIFAYRRMMKAHGGQFPPSKPEEKGFEAFLNLTEKALSNAPVNSYVTAEVPSPSVELIIRVAGQRAGINSYRLEIRMGYRREDHLAMIQEELDKQPLAFERIDKGRGLIKLRSEKVDEAEDLYPLCRAIKSRVTFDLADQSITSSKSIRSS